LRVSFRPKFIAFCILAATGWLLLLGSDHICVAQTTNAPSELSSPFTPSPEQSVEADLLDFREFALPSASGARLGELQQSNRNDIQFSGLFYSCDLFRSLADFNLGNSLAAQAVLDRGLKNSYPGSRSFIEASLLSALQFYSHAPLRREDVEAGVERMTQLEQQTAPLPDDIKAESALWLAEGFTALGLFGEAHTHYDTACASATESRMLALALFRRGELAEREDRYANAESDFRAASRIESSPLRIFAKLRTAAVLRTEKKYEASLVVLNELDSLGLVSKLQIRTSARNMQYVSPLVEALYLRHRNVERLINPSITGAGFDFESLRDNETSPPPAQLVSPYWQSEVALLRGSAQIELGQYAKATVTLAKGQQILVETPDTIKSGFAPVQRRFVGDALRFEKGWSLFQQDQYDAAAREFLALASQDTISRLLIRREANLSLREQGRIADRFYETPHSPLTVATLDSSLVHHNTIDTTFFFYNDFPERSRFYAGVALARAERYSEAEHVLIGLTQDKSVLYSSRANYQLGLVKFIQKNYLGASSLLEPLSSEQTSSGAFSALLMGELSYRKNLFEKAVGYFSTALHGLAEADSNSRALAHLERGLSLIPLGAWDAARSDLQAYFATNPAYLLTRTDEAHFWLGRAMLRHGDIDGAEKQFQTVLKEYPQSTRVIDAQYGYAWTLFRHARFPEASQAFQHLLDLDTITRYAYDGLARAGDAEYAVGHLSDANDLYNQAVDRPAFNDLRTTRALYQLGVTRIRLDSGRSAMNVFRYLTTKFPKSDLLDRAYFNSALAAYSINLPTEAEASIEKLVTKFPSSAFAPRSLLVAGAERENRNDDTHALIYFERVLRDYAQSNEAGDALFRKQDALIRLKRYPEVVAAADSFLVRSPSSELVPKVLFHKGELQLRIGEPAKGISTLEQFLKQYPEHASAPQSKFLIARAYASLGDTTRSITSLAKVTAEYPKSEAADNSLLELARLSKSRHQLDSAAVYYQKTFDLDYYSYDAAPTAISEYADLLIASNAKDSAIKMLNLLTMRYTLQTSLGAKAQFRAAQMLLELNKRSEARIALQTIANSRRHDALGSAALVRIGEIYIGEKAWQPALLEFAMAEHDNSLASESNTRRLFGVAEAQTALGKKPLAIVALKALTKRDDLSDHDAARAKAMLDALTPKPKAKPAKKKGGRK
jgi:TolA-binding protein